jgi:hypothetical protein
VEVEERLAPKIENARRGLGDAGPRSDRDEDVFL